MGLIEKLTAIAEAIRGKTGKEASLTLEQMVTEIEGIEAGGGKPIFESFLTDKIANHIVSVCEFVPGGILEDTTPPPPPKYYYNGLLLPEIPADVLAQYPYAYMISETRFSAFSVKPYFYAADAYPSCLKADGSGVTYKLTENGNDWVLIENHTSMYIILTSLRWSNYDVPNGSADSTDIYFYGSEPVIAE